MYNEDAIERMTELVRFHLQANVLALHDARLATIHRPALLKQRGAPPLNHSLLVFSPVSTGHCAYAV